MVAGRQQDRVRELPLRRRGDLADGRRRRQSHAVHREPGPRQLPGLAAARRQLRDHHGPQRRAPSTAGGTFDLKVDTTVVKSAAGHGDQGTDTVSPGVYLVSEAASGATSLDDFATSYSCTKNGHPDVSGPGISIEVAVKFGDAEVCAVTNTLGARTPFGSNVAATPIDVSTGDFPVSILFGFVGSAGVTHARVVGDRPEPAGGFDVDGSYYHLESTAEFAAAEVCFPYTGTPPSIVHWVAGTPEILLTTRHTSTLVCAEVGLVLAVRARPADRR